MNSELNNCTGCKEAISPSLADGFDAVDDAPETRYAADTDPGHRRRFAQFFTPFPVASFMARWVLDGGRRRHHILDPAFGLGVFARAVAAGSEAAHRITGFEVDPVIADRSVPALEGLPGRIALGLERSDYLDSDWDGRFDGVLCNPPYLRFQEYAGRGARLKSLEDRMGIKLAGLTNLHCLFLLKSLHQLGPGGRAAYIMPWEFLNAGYGTRIKEYLLGTGALRHAVVFDSRRGVFAGAVTTACILLFDRAGEGGSSRDVAFHRATAGQDLLHLYRGRIADSAAASPPAGAGFRALDAGHSLSEGETRVVAVRELAASAKWKGYWKDTPYSGYLNMVPLGDFAAVLRGIATGCNDFFTLDEAARREAGLPGECLLPCVSRARDVEGPVFRASDFEALKTLGRRVWLLDAEGRAHAEVAAYLEAGRRDKVDERFLTRHRTPWFALEKRSPAPLWVSVFNRAGGLKPVLNRAGVRNLTAFHCLYPKPGAEPFLDILFAWLLTATARALVRENGREYGAGLEKIEPKDLSGSLVPDFTRMLPEDMAQVNAYVAGLESGNSYMGMSDLEAIFRNYI